MLRFFKKKNLELPVEMDKWDMFVDWCCNKEPDEIYDGIPYYYLFWYYAEVENGGHLQFFENTVNRGWDIVFISVQLEYVLDKDLIDNFKKGLAIYQKNNIIIDSVQDYVTAARVDYFKEMDNYYYRNHNNLVDVLTMYAQTTF